MVVERFCPICAVAAGSVIAGGAALGGSNDKNDSAKAMYRASGLALIVSAISLFVFYRYVKECSSCSASK